MNVSHVKYPFCPKQKTPLPIFSNRVSAGILATLIKVGCNSRKSAHMIYPFLNFIWSLEVTFVSN